MLYRYWRRSYLGLGAVAGTAFRTNIEVGQDSPNHGGSDSVYVLDRDEEFLQRDEGALGDRRVVGAGKPADGISAMADGAL